MHKPDLLQQKLLYPDSLVDRLRLGKNIILAHEGRLTTQTAVPVALNGQSNIDFQSHDSVKELERLLKETG